MKLIKKLILNHWIARWFFPLLLRLHNQLYFLLTKFGPVYFNGVHPKHLVLKYKEWFKEQVQPGQHVLDIGCNAGDLSKAMADGGARVTGIEINPQAVQQAKNVYRDMNLSFIHADALSFDYGTLDVQDTVVLSNVLEHIEDRPGFIRKLISQVNWDSDKAQRFLIRVPRRDRDWVTLIKAKIGVYYFSDPTHFIEYELEELEAELVAAGLKVISHECRYGESYVVASVK